MERQFEAPEAEIELSCNLVEHWKTSYVFPLVCLTNKFIPSSTYMYHLHERDLTGKEGVAGLIELEL